MSFLSISCPSCCSRLGVSVFCIKTHDVTGSVVGGSIDEVVNDSLCAASESPLVHCDTALSHIAEQPREALLPLEDGETKVSAPETVQRVPTSHRPMRPKTMADMPERDKIRIMDIMHVLPKTDSGRASPRHATLLEFVRRGYPTWDVVDICCRIAKRYNHYVRTRVATVVNNVLYRDYRREDPVIELGDHDRYMVNLFFTRNESKVGPAALVGIPTPTAEHGDGSHLVTSKAKRARHE